MLNGNVVLVAGAFRQQIWKDTSGGFYSIWYANPPSVAAGNQGMAASIPWSSLAHELGHNFTLNFPSAYIFGGTLDGNANALYSETMAQIFQHAAVYEVANNSAALGISTDLAADLAQDARATASVVRRGYEDYIAGGKHFATWNDPSTPSDETFLTFMTVAYQFLATVEQNGVGYSGSVKRLTAFLRRFNPEWASAYAPSQNSAQADRFRATLMIAAISYGSGKDLRATFRDLNFPLDDAIFDKLSLDLSPVTISSVNTAGADTKIAQNTWIEITGNHLVPGDLPATDFDWSTAPEFGVGTMPTQLRGVSVKVNGKAAYVYFICSKETSKICKVDQINALTPLDPTIGPVEVTVTNGPNSSPPFVVPMQSARPSLLLFDVSRNVVSTHANGSLLGPPLLFPGLSTPAAPAEIVVLYGVGFGQPQTPLTSGASTQSGTLVPSPTCQIGSKAAVVSYAGLISPGLYQLNVQIPDGASGGSNSIACTHAGFTTVMGNVIAVQR